MKKHALTALALVLPVAVIAIVVEGATSYSVKDPKGVNVIRFTLDGRLEQISGHVSAIDGTLTFDPEKPDALTGKVTVEAAKMVTSHERMTEHMHSALWLDVAQYPKISFEIKKVANVRALEGLDKAWSMDVTGDLALHGVTKSLTVPIKVTYLPGQLLKRNRGPGDLMVVRSSFAIKRSDFGLTGNQTLDIVAEEVGVAFSIAAFAPKSPQSFR